MSQHPQTGKYVGAPDLARMGRKPGPFRLQLDGQEDAAAPLACLEVVRALPGRRLVCRAEWQGRDVFAKLYLDDARGWQAEQQGLQALQDAGIDAPELVHAGTADRGAVHVILLAAVQPATSFAVAWAQVHDDASRIKLLNRALRTITAHHRAGLEQRDIHLDNFLLSGERLYTLDGGGIHVHAGGELSLEHSVDNLALFFAQFYPRHDRLITSVLPAYTARRGWDDGSIAIDALKERVTWYRGERRRRYLKKVFRDCTAFACFSSWLRYRVVDRDMATHELLTLLEDPDASLETTGSRYLKQGNTSTLWLVQVGERLLVVKRYNIKGLVHRISRAFRPTRAAVSWENAHRLGIYGIPTARPVALVENRFGPMRGRAWYISEFVPGNDASSLCDRISSDTEGAIAACRSIESLLRQLAYCRITHGDMKATNFILAEDGAVVIDLDAMREHEAEDEYLTLKLRDLERFMRNWAKCPRVAGLFRVALSDSLA